MIKTTLKLKRRKKGKEKYLKQVTANGHFSKRNDI